MFCSSHRNVTELSSVIPLHVGTAFGETFFVAPGMAQASDARKF